MSATRIGLLLGAIAVVFWSFGSSLVYLGAREVGPWQFVGLASFAGGALQMICWRVSRGEVRSAVCLPWRLWVVTLGCFVVYGLVWPWALVTSSPNQVFGVSLVNYLWPVLTVVFSSWWVPGVRLTLRTVVAVVLAVAGLLCANWQHLCFLFVGNDSATNSALHKYLPYFLALVAAVTWALYSTLLARWREWARRYVTSPLGFLLIGGIAAAITGLGGGSRPNLVSLGTLLTLLYGAGPLAIGYLLWEVALSKARVHSLSLLAAVTPVLSTFLLCIFLRSMPGPELALAALLVSSGVVLTATNN